MIIIALAAGSAGWFLADLLPGRGWNGTASSGAPPAAPSAPVSPGGRDRPGGRDHGQGTDHVASPDRNPTIPATAPGGITTARDPVTGAVVIVLPDAWPRAGRLRWELAGNRDGEAYGHVLDAGWRLGEGDAVHLDGVVLDGKPVVDALTVERHRGRLAVREEIPHDPVVRRLAFDACRHLLGLVADLPLGQQEAGGEFSFGGSRFRLATMPDGGARFVPVATTAAGNGIEVTRIDGRLRVMRTIFDRDETLRVVRRLHIRFDR